MSIVRIFANDIELNFKKTSLTLKKENNSLSDDFKVTHSSFPFLIIEDENCKRALGSSDITSINKKKIIPVTVLEFGVKYYGELQQLSVQKGFRKCNLKYSSDFLQIMKKQISEFMPSVSVIPGETSPEPFSEESSELVSGTEHWETYPVSMIGQFFPDVKFNFPTMYWKNKYGVDLEATDNWYNYKNHINLFGVNESEEDIFIINTGEIDGTTITINQPNVVSPQVFLLSPLHYICEYLGWTYSGDFVSHNLIKRLLLLSTKDNLSKTALKPEGDFISFDGATWTLIEGSNFFPDDDIWRKLVQEYIPVAGDYTLKYRFEMPPRDSAWAGVHAPKFRLIINPAGDDNSKLVFNKFYFYNSGENIVVEGEIEFSSEVGNMNVIFETSFQYDPVSYSLEYLLLDYEKEYNFMHPTIDLGRFVPKWTVGNYLNYLKTFFNLDITLDDFKKEITINLNENIDNTESPVILDKSLFLESNDLAVNSSFILKYENDEDLALFINKEGIATYENQNDDFTKEIKSKFKIVPRNGYTSELSEEVESKAGTGLIIYEVDQAPYTSEYTLNGYNLEIDGVKGIYETFHRRWLKFRLNASGVELKGNFTEVEISKIYKAKSIYVDNQRYRIESLQYNEQTNNYYSLKMVLESVNF